MVANIGNIISQMPISDCTVRIYIYIHVCVGAGTSLIYVTFTIQIMFLPKRLLRHMLFFWGGRVVCMIRLFCANMS